MTEKIPGYGDPQCYKCRMILDPEMAEFCRIMVRYTRLQEKAAHKGNWNVAIFWENKQNRIALQVLQGLCTPGFNRV